MAKVINEKTIETAYACFVQTEPDRPPAIATI
jgi:hypothetical protein